jgi:hypothetical protein
MPSEDGVRLSWFALERASGLALEASSVFAVRHLAPDKHAGLPAKRSEIDRIALALNERAANRWGSENPYPEKWKI